VFSAGRNLGSRLRGNDSAGGSSLCEGMRKILVIAPSWVGDAVLSQPMLARLRERHAELHLDVFAPPWVAPVFRFMPEVDNVIDNPFAHGDLKLAARRRAGRELAAGRYDQAIVLPNSFKSALVPFFARIPIRTGFRGELRGGILNDARRLDKDALPLMVERFAALAQTRNTPLTHPVANPRLSVAAERTRAVMEKFGALHDQRVVVFCPGAEYGPAKRWPVEHFARCAREFAREGALVWALGSGKDREVGAAIEAHSAGACRNLCGATDLAQAIHIIAGAALVITNDSGLMHVAAALDRPTVALFGSSSARFTPPLSPRAAVVSLNVECSPCFERECPLGHFKCLRDLTPERVMAEAKALSAS
jgi:heptosyltransferase II